MGKSGEGKRAIVISAHKELMPLLKVILQRYGIIIDTSYDSLSSLLAITKSVRETGNTIFIRKAFSRFVGDWGLPHLLIIDDRISLSIDSWQDPDTKKILLTFLISILVIHAASKTAVPVNLVLLDVTGGKSNSHFYEKEPVRILELLGTENATLNGMIVSLKSKPEDFEKIFAIKVVRADDERQVIETEIDRFLSGKKFQAPGAVPAQTVTQNSVYTDTISLKSEGPEQPRSLKAAGEISGSVIVRLDEKAYSINGVNVDNPPGDVYGQLIKDEINITGSWVTQNQRAVHDRVLAEVKKGAGEGRFTKSSVMVLNLTRCLLDQSIIASLLPLVTRELVSYADVKILVNFKNANILEKSTGYRLISKKVYHAY